MNNMRHKKPHWFLHPRVTLFFSGYSILLGIVCSAVFQHIEASARSLDLDMTGDWPIAHPWLSLLLGIIAGAFGNFWQKAVLRKHAAFIVGQQFLPVLERFRWKNYRRSLLLGLPLITTMLVLLGDTYCFQSFSFFPAMFGIGSTYFLVYPEQKRIYESVQDRLEQAI